MFTLIMEKIKDWRGYTVFEILPDDHDCNIFHYETKEEFDNDFRIEKSKYIPYEPKIVPQNIIEGGRQHITCMLQGEERYLHIAESYLAIDGEYFRNR